MPAKPGKVGGGDVGKRVGGGGPKGGAKGGGVRKSGPVRGKMSGKKSAVRQMSTGPLAVNVRIKHLRHNSSQDLVRPVNDVTFGNEFVRAEYRRNSGHKDGTSTGAMMALGESPAKSLLHRQCSIDKEMGRLAPFSAATVGVSEINKSMTNIFLSSENSKSFKKTFDGSSLNLSKSKTDLSSIGSEEASLRKQETQNCNGTRKSARLATKIIFHEIHSPDAVSKRKEKHVQNIVFSDEEDADDSHVSLESLSNLPLRNFYNRFQAAELSPIASSTTLAKPKPHSAE